MLSLRELLGDAVREDPNARSLSYFFTGDIAWADERMIAALKVEAATAGTKNARLCLHTGPDAAIHDMIIVEHAGCYYRPHKHMTKGETCHAISGRLLFVAFDDDGNVIGSRLLGDGDGLMFRVGAGQWHTVIPVDDQVVYHEAKLGPFLGAGDMVFPDWAPDGENASYALAWQDRLVAGLQG